MQTLNNAISYLLSFEPFVLLPIIIFVLALIFSIKIHTAIKSSLQIGIGFVGIFMTFDFFVGIIKPVVNAIIERMGLNMAVLDVGWPPLAAITWSFNLAPILLVTLILVNAFMLIFKLTKVINIDIWNYWHMIFLGTMVYFETKSVSLTFIVSIISFILTLKLGEWTASFVNESMDMEGICIPHLAGAIHYPLALVGNKIIDKIPGLNNVDADSEAIQEKLGLLGEPMIIGFILGILLGLFAGYEMKAVLEIGVKFSAVIFILPKMSSILGGALIPISEGMKSFIQEKLPKMGTTYIGLDVAILFGLPENMVTAILLIPTAILLAIILPGVKFIPLGDLTNLLVPVAFITLATGGNIVRAYLIGIPIVIGTLYSASYIAPMLTNMAMDINLSVVESGMFTSFLDGGNLFRVWIIMILRGNLLAIIFIPIILFMLYYTYKEVSGKNIKTTV